MDSHIVISAKLSRAVAALKRIVRKQAGFVHTKDPHNDCDCPQCIAKSALDDIDAGEGRDQ